MKLCMPRLRATPGNASAFVAVGLVALLTLPVAAQYRVNNGTALDRNAQAGSGGFNPGRTLEINPLLTERGNIQRSPDLNGLPNRALPRPNRVAQGSFRRPSYAVPQTGLLYGNEPARFRNQGRAPTSNPLLYGNNSAFRSAASTIPRGPVYDRPDALNVQRNFVLPTLGGASNANVLGTRDPLAGRRPQPQVFSDRYNQALSDAALQTINPSESAFLLNRPNRNAPPTARVDGRPVEPRGDGTNPEILDDMPNVFESLREQQPQLPQLEFEEANRRELERYYRDVRRASLSMVMQPPTLRVKEVLEPQRPMVTRDGTTVRQRRISTILNPVLNDGRGNIVQAGMVHTMSREAREANERPGLAERLPDLMKDLDLPASTENDVPSSPTGDREGPTNAEKLAVAFGIYDLAEADEVLPGFSRLTQRNATVDRLVDLPDGSLSGSRSTPVNPDAFERDYLAEARQARQDRRFFRAIAYYGIARDRDVQLPRSDLVSLLELQLATGSVERARETLELFAQRYDELPAPDLSFLLPIERKDLIRVLAARGADEEMTQMWLLILQHPTDWPSRFRQIWPTVEANAKTRDQNVPPNVKALLQLD